MEIITATAAQLEQVSRLFDQYRVFYQQASDIDAAKRFIAERIALEESVIFLAMKNGVAIGFTQLYPSFTSVGMARIWILNDLFVHEAHRNKGVAQMLMEHAIDYSKTTGRKKIVLSTAYDNTNAQSLYEKLGFSREDFYSYELTTNL